MPAPRHQPLAFATIIGGTLTLIGTSTNLLASDLAADLSREGYLAEVLLPQPHHW